MIMKDGFNSLLVLLYLYSSILKPYLYTDTLQPPFYCRMTFITAGKTY